MMAQAAQRISLQTPTSKEGYLYRTIFDGAFKNPSACLTAPVGPSIAAGMSQTSTQPDKAQDLPKRAIIQAANQRRPTIK